VAPASNAKLRIEAASGFIDAIDVVRNGRLVHRISPEVTPSAISDRSETILYLELGWGARGRNHRWDGRIAVEGGEILSVEPRFRGAEIVSPLEGDEAGHALPWIVEDGDAIAFGVTAEANPNNATPATQGLALRVKAEAGATIRAELSGQRLEIPAERLFESAKSGNLGPIDSPAWRFHAMPKPHQWQWCGDVALGSIEAGENLYVRLRQVGGQMAWTSPIFCRDLSPEP
jgi:hypothetical protein